MIPSLTVGYLALESMTDVQVVKHIRDPKTKSILELRETDMKEQLKECLSDSVERPETLDFQLEK